MARFSPKGYGITKEKLGTTILEKTSIALSDLKDRSEGELRTVGEVIDYLASTMVDITPAVAAQLLKSCIDGKRAVESEMSIHSADGSADMDLNEKRRSIESYSRLEGLFSRYADKEMLESLMNPMKRVKLANESHVVIPDKDDWVEVNPQEANIRRGVCVVEIKNGQKYDAPHFVYYYEGTEKSFNRAKIIEAVAEKWPQIREIQKKQVEPQYDRTGFMVNYEEMLEAPMIGIFDVGNAASYGPGEKAPYGVMIYRKRK